MVVEAQGQSSLMSHGAILQHQGGSSFAETMEAMILGKKRLNS